MFPSWIRAFPFALWSNTGCRSPGALGPAELQTPAISIPFWPIVFGCFDETLPTSPGIWTSSILGPRLPSKRLSASIGLKDRVLKTCRRDLTSSGTTCCCTTTHSNSHFWDSSKTKTEVRHLSTWPAAIKPLCSYLFWNRPWCGSCTLAIVENRPIPRTGLTVCWPPTFGRWWVEFMTRPSLNWSAKLARCHSTLTTIPLWRHRRGLCTFPSATGKTPAHSDCEIFQCSSSCRNWGQEGRFRSSWALSVTARWAPP